MVRWKMLGRLKLEDKRFHYLPSIGLYAVCLSILMIPAYLPVVFGEYYALCSFSICLLSLIFSLAAAGLWTKRIKDKAGIKSRAFFGLAYTLLLVFVLDALREVLSDVPRFDGSPGLMRGSLVFWIAMIGFTIKAPWDDLRDVIGIWISQRIDKFDKSNDRL